MSIKAKVKAFDDEIAELNVLKATPFVLSVEKRCEKGYCFI